MPIESKDRCRPIRRTFAYNVILITRPVVKCYIAAAANILRARVLDRPARAASAAIRASGQSIISVRHVHRGADGQNYRPPAARGHRPVRGARRARMAVLSRHVDVRFRGLGLDFVTDHQRSGQVHAVHAHAVDAGE